MAWIGGKFRAGVWGQVACVMLAALLCLAFFPASARASWILRGSAYLNGTQVVLTPDSQEQMGAAWFDQQINLNQDFDVTYTMNFGTHDSNGADGISFVLSRDSRGTSAVGTGTLGEWIGMNGIYPAIAVEVDTFQNVNQGQAPYQSIGDPTYDHIGVDEYPSDGSGYPNHAGGGPVQASSTSTNIEDGANHTLRCVWTASSKTLRIYFDGSLRYTYSRDFITNIFGGNTTVWWGFVASTGGSTNLQSLTPSTPTVSIIKPVSPSVIPLGGTVTYEIRVTNNGTSTIWISQLTDTMPAGFSYVSGTSTGITTADPTISGQTLTWNISGCYAVQPGATQSLYFNNTVPTTAGSYCNTFTVSGPNILPTVSGSCQSNLSVGEADLAITKNHTGYFTDGGTGTFTIDVSNLGPDNAPSVTVSDDLLNGLAYLSSSGTGWTTTASVGATHVEFTYSGTAASGASLPPITLNVSVPSGSPASISNTATVSSGITDPDSSNNSDIDTVTIIGGANTGNKPLYLSSGTALSRTPNSTAPSATTLTKGSSATWTLPATIGSLTLAAGTLPIYLYLSSNAAASRTITVSLATTGGTTLAIGTVGPTSYTLSTTATLYTFNLSLASSQTLAAGTQFVLTVTNNTSGSSTRNIIVTPGSGLTGSRVGLTSSTVIKVDSIGAYNAAYSGGTAPGWFLPASTVHVRAVVSDPFGASDITGAYVDIVNANGSTLVSNVSMGSPVATGTGTKTFEYAYTLPSSPEGAWTARVRALEGSENLVNDVKTTTFDMGLPHMVVTKTSYVASDPTGEAHPKAIPGALVVYTITVANTGYGGADSGTVKITDPVPSNTSLYVSDIGGTPSGPVSFSSTGSGLTLTFSGLSSDTDDLDFANSGGYGYHPTASPSTGCDANVTEIKINPKGVFNPGASGTSSFTLQFAVKVN